MSDSRVPSAQSFDIPAFMRTLDTLLNEHNAAHTDEFLQQSLRQAQDAHDDAATLAVLNEIMGFYRSQSRHDDNAPIVEQALALAASMGLQNNEAGVTTLINAATAQRAAGRNEQARTLYEQALASAQTVYAPNDRRLAALHNNYSMLFSQLGDFPSAEHQLREALRIITDSSVDPSRDVDIASTCVNLALVLMQEGDEHALQEAQHYVDEALSIYARANAQKSAHYASALAAHGQISVLQGHFREAVHDYEQACAHIAQCYGTHTDQYAITTENLAQARALLIAQETEQAEHTEQSSLEADPTTLASTLSHAASARLTPPSTTSSTLSTTTSSSSSTPSSVLSGMQLARQYWLDCGKPMIQERYPEYVGRIAAGLVGHGSECYGFDDEYSRDHDFGPRFCLWLTPDDYAVIGESLQADYEQLPHEFAGVTRSDTTPRAQNTNRRDGVFAIDQFFTNITGYPTAPAANEPYAWLMLDEPTLAAATNGRIFADPLGVFSATRQSFKLMPDDVRLALISRRLGMIAQAGQYNVPRMLARGDGAAAWESISEFTQATVSLIFLLNNPVTAGYAPYYKWRFAALRTLSRRAGMRLTHIEPQLARILQLSSSACFGGVGFGEGGNGSTSSIDTINTIIEGICTDIVHELQRQGLTTSDAVFLEWQRPYVESHIVSDAACLHSLPMG